MSKATGRTRQERRLVDISQAAPSPPRWIPDLEDAEEFTYFVRLDADSQIYVRQVILRGQVVAFA